MPRAPGARHCHFTVTSPSIPISQHGRGFHRCPQTDIRRYHYTTSKQDLTMADVMTYDIPKTCKAGVVVNEGPDFKLEVEDVPVPEPGRFSLPEDLDLCTADM
jgi:hypothetical protein